MAADIYAVVTGPGLRRPALVGISMGGTVALQYALDHPADLSRLVLVGSFPGIGAEFASIGDQQLAFIDTHSLREIAEQRMAVAFTASVDPGTKGWVIDMIAGGDLDGYRSQARATRTFDVRHRLAEITAPTTIIHGELDATVPAAFATLMAEKIPVPPCTSSTARATSPIWRPRTVQPPARRRAGHPQRPPPARV